MFTANYLNDRLAMTDTVKAGEAAMTVITKLQDFKKDEQIHGTAAVFFIMCEVFKVDPREVFGMTQRMMNDADWKLLPEFRAVHHYLMNEVLV